ncbi:MFS transporter [Pseudovibrio ascidiaceicola]|uniref:MFS transporter n=1 Tax=Pseudovibrio ascidiaceicola TaxID=285279 RepID=UPI003D36F459
MRKKKPLSPTSVSFSNHVDRATKLEEYLWNEFTFCANRLDLDVAGMKGDFIAIKLLCLNVFTMTTTSSLYLWCSYLVMERYESMFLASAVFSIQWVGPIVIFGPINWLFQSFPSRKIIGSAVMVIVGFLFVLFFSSEDYVPFLVALVVGTCEVIVKVARLIVIKRFVPIQQAGRVNSFSASGQFIGGALGGALFAMIVFDPSGLLILICSLLLLLASLISISLLPHESSAMSMVPYTPAFQQLKAVSNDIWANKDLLKALFGLVAVVALIQGFHNTARIGLPLFHWSGDEEMIGLLQTQSAIVTTLGAFLYIFIDRKFGGAKLLTPASILIAFSLIAVGGVADPISGFIIYAAMIFSFEYVFMLYQATVIKTVDQEKSADIFSCQYLMTNIALSSFTLLCGAMAEAIGYFTTSVLFVVGFGVAIAYSRPKKLID